MSKIEAYQPRCTLSPYDDWAKFKPDFYVTHENTGGFNPETKAITPFKADFEEFSAEDFLHNMTAAVEAGCVDSDTFVLDFFGSSERAEAFADFLDEYAESEFWVNERFFHAMVDALNTYEGGCVTFESMAEKFREKCEDEVKALSKSKPTAKKKTK